MVAAHSVEKRLARWLLKTHDRVAGEDFPATHEILSTFLGVTRPGVTLAVGSFARAGLVRHERGRMTVRDRVGLEAVACECFAVGGRIQMIWFVTVVERCGHRSLANRALTTQGL